MSATAVPETQMGDPWPIMNDGYTYQDQIRGADGAGNMLPYLCQPLTTPTILKALSSTPGTSVLQFYINRYSNSGSESE